MEAFVYCWTNKESGMKYYGYHKGTPEDGYISSSQNEAFSVDYYAGKLDREILFTGSEQECLNFESSSIKAARARGESLYNNNVGSGSAFDEKELVKLVKDFRSNKMHKGIREETDIINALPRIQVRANNTDSSKVNSIAQKIRDAGDKYEEYMEPVVIIKKFPRKFLPAPWNAPEGTHDAIIDGNHTAAAAEKAGLPSVAITRVEYGTRGLVNLSNVLDLGNALNSRTPQDITLASEEDIKQAIRVKYESGVDIKEPTFREYVQFMYQHLPKATLTRMINSIADGSVIVDQDGKVSINPVKIIDWNKERRVQYLETAFKRDGETIYFTSRKDIYRGFAHLQRDMYRGNSTKGVLYHYAVNVETCGTRSEVDEVRKIARYLGLNIRFEALPEAENTFDGTVYEYHPDHNRKIEDQGISSREVSEEIDREDGREVPEMDLPFLHRCA